MTKIWNTGNPSSRSQSLFPAPHQRNIYGAFRRRHASIDQIDKLGMAARASCLKRNKPITLATKPFDHTEGD